jgi:hypothetical protein
MAWSYAGGLFQSAVLREAVVERIGRQPHLPLLPPIGGALLAAAQHIGLNTDEARFIRLFFQPLLVVWALWATGGWKLIRSLLNKTKATKS